MRRAWLPVIALWCVGCPQPEDTFVLSGQLVEADGSPRAGVEVTLRRARLASETRCDALDVLHTAQTGADGRYRFELIRQEITAGVEARRFFSIEAARTPEGSLSQRFWFPNADLELGPLGQFVESDRQLETNLDGHTVWRGSTLFLERKARQRSVNARRDWINVPIDSLGRIDVIPVETRFENDWVETEPRNVASSAALGAECPEFGVTPCPLTDGRFLPFSFPPDTRQLLFNFKREVSVGSLLFHGLQLERPAVRALFDFNFVADFTNLNPMPPATLNPRIFEQGLNTCDEPGAFFRTGSSSVIQPVAFRVRFQDAAGELVPILSLQELSVR